MRQAATSKRQGRRPLRAFSARALAAAAMALLLVLQSLVAAAAPALRDGHGRPGAVVAAAQPSADCAGDAPDGGAPRKHGAGGAHFCILYCAGVGADGAAARPEPHIAVAPPAPPGRRELMERRLAGDDGRPIGFMSSWSPQAPPFHS